MKKMYEDLFKLQAGQAQVLELLWPNTQWENPFIPRPILWKGRPLYPTRLLVRPKGVDLYKKYLLENPLAETDAADSAANPDVIKLNKGLTDKQFIKVVVHLDSAVNVPERLRTQYCMA